MTIITFSQPKLKKDWRDRITRIFNVVKTRATPDLWIKVFIYRNKVVRHADGKEHTITPIQANGHYRCFQFGGHGFYDEEFKFLEKHPKIEHVITLKIGENANDEDIASLMAHEFRHYLQWKKFGVRKMNPKLNNGKRAVQVERDANKWEKKRIDRLIGERKIKHKASKKYDGFIYWVFCDCFARMFGETK